MEHKWHYFITDDYLASADELANDLSPGPRIFKTSIDFPFTFNNGDGPYKSIRALKRNSLIFKRLTQQNGKRVAQILQEKNIVEFTNTVIPYPRNKGIPRDMLRMITHATKGNIVKGQITGVHYYDPEKIKIVEVIETSSKNGVWSAIIKYYDRNSDQWLLKDKPSTLFPKEWTIQQLFYECMHALESKDIELVKGSKNKYVSYTYSGIEVHLVKVNGKLKTIYPVLKG